MKFTYLYENTTNSFRNYYVEYEKALYKIYIDEEPYGHNHRGNSGTFYNLLLSCMAVSRIILGSDLQYYNLIAEVQRAEVQRDEG
jgi:hypothetical protein